MPFSRWSRRAPSAAALALPFAAATAVAQVPGTQPAEPALHMTWQSDDAACSGDGVSARALQLVTPGVVPRPLRARVAVRRDAAQWLVRLQTESDAQSGHRVLRAESCSELKQAIALLLAMTMESKGDVLPPDPAPEVPKQPPPAPRAPPPVTPAAPSPPAPPPLAPAAPSSGAIRADASPGLVGWFARLDGKAAFELKPSFGWGVGVSVGIRLGDVDVGASAAYWPSTRADARGRPGYMTLAREDLGLRACWNVWQGESVALAPCIAPGLTRFRFETREVRDPDTGTTKPRPNVTASADVRYAPFGEGFSLVVTPGLTVARPEPFELGLSAGAAAPANGETTESEEIYRTGRFSPRLEVGVDARF